jgi:hypothetical protein
MIAERMILSTRKYSKMYASTKEALLARVTAILDVCEVEYSVQDFMSDHVETYGNMYVGLQEEYEEEWAHKVCDHAMVLLTGGAR